MAEYEWRVVDLDRYLNFGGKKNVVNCIFYKCSCFDKKISCNVQGSTKLVMGNMNLFKDFDELTENQVLTWLFAALGQNHKREIELGAKSKLDKIINPKPVRGLPDWN